MFSGAPQVYRPPSIRPRVPTPQAAGFQRGVRPVVNHPPGAVISARPTMSSPSVVTGLPVAAAPPGFVPAVQMPGMPLATPIVGAPSLQAPVSSIPLPPEHVPIEPKPSTSSADTGTGDGDKGKSKKKKEKKPKKLVRCAGGTAWEDQSLQDWDPSKYT